MKICRSTCLQAYKCNEQFMMEGMSPKPVIPARNKPVVPACNKPVVPACNKLVFNAWNKLVFNAWNKPVVPACSWQEPTELKDTSLVGPCRKHAGATNYIYLRLTCSPLPEARRGDKIYLFALDLWGPAGGMQRRQNIFVCA